jgi:hypothetical protein
VSGRHGTPFPLSGEAVGTNFNAALAESYQEKSQYHLALPLFFQALRLCQEPCHIAVLSKSRKDSHVLLP